MLSGIPVLNRITLAYVLSNLVHVSRNYICHHYRKRCAQQQLEQSVALQSKTSVPLQQNPRFEIVELHATTTNSFRARQEIARPEAFLQASLSVFKQSCYYRLGPQNHLSSERSYTAAGILGPRGAMVVRTASRNAADTEAKNTVSPETAAAESRID